jgi:dihydroorotate dehydrogenase
MLIACRVLQAVDSRNKLSGKKPPLLLKIAPDLTDQDKKDIASIVTKKEVYILNSFVACLLMTFCYVTVEVHVGSVSA